MRPRVFPAEDVPLGREPHKPAAASMRPRVFPAEDSFSRLMCGCFHGLQ